MNAYQTKWGSRPKAPWVKMRRLKFRPKTTYRLPKVSDRQKERNREYLKVRNAYMLAHPFCECGCGKKATDCHHRKGRIGSLLTDTRFFMALARPCHDLCKNDPEEARRRGLLCAKGEWGKSDG